MATVDLSIYQNALRPPRSVSDFTADIDQQEGNALTLQAKRMQMQQAQQAMRQQNALQGYLQGGNVTPEGLMRYDPKLAMDLEKTGATVAKDRAETTYKGAQTKASELASAKQQIELILQVASSARDQASYTQGLQMLAAGGVDVSSIPQQFDPAFVQNAAAQALSVKDRIDAAHKQAVLEESTKHNRATEQTAAGQLSVSRGNLAVAQGNLGVSRERLSLDKAAPRGVYDANRGLLVDPRAGTAQPVIGPDGKAVEPRGRDAPLTEGQAKANMFGNRMQESDRILTSLEGKYSPVGVNAKLGAENLPGVGGVAGMVGNAMLSSESQQAEQAQRDFINAVLRRESGAVISQPEFDNARKQYFPQPNDGQKVLEQKRKNRQAATQLMLAEVPEAKRKGIPSAPARGVAGSWDAPAVKFLGFE